MATRTKHYESELKDLDRLLQVIESEMGPDAQLETTEYSKGGIMGLGGRKMIAITATVEVNPQRIGSGTRRRISLADNWNRAGGAGEDEPVLTTAASHQEETGEKLADLARSRSYTAESERAAAAAPAAPASLAETVAVPEPPLAAPAEETAPPVEPPVHTAARHVKEPAPWEPLVTQEAASSTAQSPADELDALTASVTEIRNAVERLAQTEPEPATPKPTATKPQPSPPAPDVEPPAVVSAANAKLAESLRQVFDRLVDWNIRSADALALIDQAMAHYAPDAEPTPDGLFAATVTEMLRPLRSTPGLQTAPGQRRVVALVGSTGSGKTSLAAKLAARYAYEHDLRVALVSMDTYRIAAVDQLRTFAEIMGLPLEIAYTPDEYARLSDTLSADLVLVDTAGRSPLSAKQMAELQAGLSARRPDEVLIALPATARYDDLALTLEAFAPVQPTGAIVTKLDETRTLGMLHNLSRLEGPPVSFFSTGQAIPEDLHEAQPGFLAGWAEGLGYG